MAPALTVEELLAEARAGLARLGPRASHAAMADGAVLVDIRSEPHRERDGEVPGAIALARNVLEWRCCVASEHRDPRIGGRDTLLIVLCDEGYQSSLAAAMLQRLGFHRATDVEGGFQAWRAAGLPVARGGVPAPAQRTSL